MSAERTVPLIETIKTHRVKLTDEEKKERRRLYDQKRYELCREARIRYNSEQKTKKRVEQRIAEGREVTGPLKPGRKPALKKEKESTENL